MAIDFTQLIYITPQIIMYILPGVIFWKVFKFVSLSIIGDIKEGSAWAAIVLTSFLIKLPFNLLDMGSLFSSMESNVVVALENIFILVFSLIAGIIFGLTAKWSWFNDVVLAKVFHRTLNDEMWNDVSDLKNGMYVKLTSIKDNVTIFGSLRGQYNHLNHIWLSVQEYKRTHFDNNELSVDYNNDTTKVILVRLSDYNIIEIEYNPISSKIK